MKVSSRSAASGFFASGGRVRARLGVVATLALVLGLLGAPPAFASTANSAEFTGGAGTVSVGGVVYARQGNALTLTVATSDDTTCVDVAGDVVGHQESAVGKKSWTFDFTAGAGNGVQNATASASPNVNNHGKCTGQSSGAQATYTLDNTGPIVTAALAPVPNALGWNKANVGITWSATDSGSGMASSPTPASDTVGANTAATTKTATAADRLGNVGNGSVTVKLDKTAPSITASRSPAANGAGWNNTDVTVGLACDDALSGIKTCTGQGSVVFSTEGSNQSISGTAIDNADNASTTGVTGISIDKTAPSLTGAPTTPPSGAGWYRGDVTIDWTATDALSGIAGDAPAPGTITGEGTDLTVGAAVGDLAGNIRTATSPAVKIDRTPPTTGISGASNTWTNGSVAVAFSPSDNLSGVAATTYTVDGGAAQSGTSFTLTAEGDHAVVFNSTDVAGNAEKAQTVHIKIDKTAPTIDHAFAPVGYTDGTWTNENITVTFVCADSGSGIADCSAPALISNEGESRQVVGTATDNAGNSATNTAVVSIDKTPPTVTARADRAPNGASWYRDDVTVSFTADDALSGIASSTAARILSEGSNQSAGGTATDAAGNSASAEVTGINVDKTEPLLTASFSDGWHTGDVAVDWTCTDALSGVVTQPAEDLVDGEGGNLASTRSCMDAAGNTATETVSGIRIDRTAPTTTASVPAPLDTGWYAGDVLVTLSGHDSLSGVAHTYFAVDGGDSQAYDGPFVFTTRGAHSITYWSIDAAGNLEAGNGNEITVKIDGAPPVTTVINPISPASGWFVSSGIPVAFSATDAESGIAGTYYAIDAGTAQTYGLPFTEDLSTGPHTITYWSVDLAGNTEAKRTVKVNVDTIAPTITGTASPAPNPLGWNNEDVTVTFECADEGSGLSLVVGCGPNGTLFEGANQTLTGQATDAAGNTSSTSVDNINVDKTRPTLTGKATTPANVAGWYKDDVTIAWTGEDALSGILTPPANSVITDEGDALEASATVSDLAGNETAAHVTGVKIDRTGPAIVGESTTSPNAAGWYKDAVTVDFVCTDNLSGVAFCPTGMVVDGDGADQSVTSGLASDLAGNTVGTTVDGISVDGSKPSTTAGISCTARNGWCTGTTATVTITATDQAGLSGVKEIHYSIDGGDFLVASGSTKTIPVSLDGSGSGRVAFYAVDNAGNVEVAQGIGLKWDNIAPTLGHTLSPEANASEWNNTDVTVTFTATDDASGVEPSTLTGPREVTAETADTIVTGTATDAAGNTGSDAVTVKLDKTDPSIEATIIGGTRGADGWYTGPVTVGFSCSDALSGVATCPSAVTITTNGENNSASGTAADNAGNTASAAISGVRIDHEAPAITDVSVAGGETYTLGAVPAATCTATDGLSGLSGPCTVTTTGGTANGVGSFIWTATAKDAAGNVTTTTGSYKVIYRFDGFLQPINDTAHQVGLTTSVFKGGSTVPAKFQLKKADGTSVLSNTAPVWLTPVTGAVMTMAIDETVYAITADTGLAFRADGTQYIYNWKTPSGGNYYGIGVRLDDGQVYYVSIGLRK